MKGRLDRPPTAPKLEDYFRGNLNRARVARERGLGIIEEFVSGSQIIENRGTALPDRVDLVQQPRSELWVIERIQELGLQLQLVPFPN